MSVSRRGIEEEGPIPDTRIDWGQYWEEYDGSIAWLEGKAVRLLAPYLEQTHRACYLGESATIWCNILWAATKGYARSLDSAFILFADLKESILRWREDCEQLDGEPRPMSIADLKEGSEEWKVALSFFVAQLDDAGLRAKWAKFVPATENPEEDQYGAVLVELVRHCWPKATRLEGQALERYAAAQIDPLTPPFESFPDFVRSRGISLSDDAAGRLVAQWVVGRAHWRHDRAWWGKDLTQEVARAKRRLRGEG